MAVGFASIEIARTGLTVNERGLTVTGHNISNVNTDGYVRQQAMIATGPYQSEVSKYGLYQFGLGADIQEIRQIRNTFLDNIYRNEATSLGFWEAKNKTYLDVQNILGDPMETGMQTVMNQFWDSWQELSKEPDSLTVRALVRQRGEALVEQINHVGLQVDKLQNDLNTEVRVRIDQVNQITKKIADLNIKILKTEVSNDSANDFRDQRNTLVDKLSKLVNADVQEMQDSQLDITVGGYFLVTKGISTDLYAAEGGDNGLFYVPKLGGTNIEVPLNSGSIKGVLESRGEVLGATGSYENGTPHTKADITFVIDNSSGSATNLSNIKSNILNYVNELNRPGNDYNLRLVAYNGSVDATLNGTTVYDSSNLADFETAINSITPAATTSNNFGGAGGAIEALGSISSTLRDGANKYALVFSGESLDGDETTTTDTTSYMNTLNTLGIKTSVITNTEYYYNGDASTENGWDSITSSTGGKLYDINSSDFKNLITKIAMDNVNDGISCVEQSSNIIPDVKKSLNALINIMVREVNYLQKSGKALNGKDGEEFFLAIDNTRPMEMGNIKLNANLSTDNGLNNIVASASTALGDNTIALKIANLRSQPIMTDVNGILNMDDYYQAIILTVGNNGSDAESICSNQENLVLSSENFRQSIMGVAIDEEMTNMMRYKYAYDASARVLNTVSQMLETIITRLGLVGR